MRKFMMGGGLAGLAIGLATGWAQQSAWPTVLWRAVVAACCGGLLFRWWAGVWIRTVQEACHSRLDTVAHIPDTSPELSSKS